MAMNTIEKNAAIKDFVINLFKDNALLDDAIQIGDYSYAIPVEVDGEERWAEMKIAAKNNKDTKTTKAFDPIAVNEKWKKEKEEKAIKAAAKAAEKKKK